MYTVDECAGLLVAMCAGACNDRIGVPQDCAGAVAFLSSNDASYMTGETIVVAGGVLSRL